jgi:SAM-dependent methyltransferase
MEVSESRTGWDEGSVKAWLAGSTADGSDALRRPWQVAAMVISTDRPDVSLVLDTASGPGGFLEVLLEEFPTARGVWLDSSEAMREEAISRLAGADGRVEYHVADILELDQAGPAGHFDVVTSSRATHHLTVEDLGHFYRQAATALRPGGWLANWDIVNSDSGAAWNARLRTARNRLRTGPGGAGSHPHPNPQPTIGQHVAAMRAAGLEEPQEVWREFVNVLLMARKPEEA